MSEHKTVKELEAMSKVELIEEVMQLQCAWNLVSHALRDEKRRSARLKKQRDEAVDRVADLAGERAVVFGVSREGGAS